MKNSGFASLALGLLLRSHFFWLFCISALLSAFTLSSESLFGLRVGNSLLEALSFSPLHPWRAGGATLLTYPWVHLSFFHWITAAALFVWFGFLMQEKGSREIRRELAWLGAYFGAGVLIALSVLLPFAPVATESDRIFGLSAIVLAQAGFLILSRPTLLISSVVAALLVATFSAQSSPLSHWGHWSGFLLGLLGGIFWRVWWARSPSSEASAQGRSYPR